MADLEQKYRELQSLILQNSLLEQLVVDKVYSYLTEKCSGFQQQNCLGIASNAIEMGMGRDAVLAALFYELSGEIDSAEKEIQELAGESTLCLLKSIAHLIKYNFYPGKDENKQAEKYRKLLFTLTDDIRVIMLLLAEISYKLTTTNDAPNIAKEALLVYSKIASRLGIAKLKWELEDMAFKHLYPDEYRKIIKLIDQKRVQRDTYIKRIQGEVQKLIFSYGIKGEVFGRTKHFYSIYRKNRIRKVPYEEIYDLAAIRIILETVEDCYTVMDLIHMEYEPIGRFRDYISRPKANGYQSLHTIVIGPDDRQIEVQIRTRQMHLVAEEGVAAHWRYKELSRYNAKGSLVSQKAKGMGHKEKEQKQLKSAIAGVQEEGTEQKYKLNLYNDIIVVSTPNHDLVELPKGATTVDFAFNIHSELGMRCTGANVNDRFVPLKTVLHSGDTVSVVTANNAKPGKDWLSFMKSQKARGKLRTYFKRLQEKDYIAQGREILSKKCGLKTTVQKDKEAILKIARVFKISDIISFFIEIGKNNITVEQIKDAISELNENQNKQRVLEQLNEKKKSVTEEEFINLARHTIKGVKADGISNLMVKYAKCCNPVPGDEIVGFITRSRGITVHRQNCRAKDFRNLKELYKDRLIPAQWDYTPPKKVNAEKIYDTKLKIVGEDRPNFLLEILNKLSKFKVSLTKADMTVKDSVATGSLAFRVKNNKELNLVIAKLQEIKGVQYIERSA